jgi:hypothetical protein
LPKGGLKRFTHSGRPRPEMKKAAALSGRTNGFLLFGCGYGRVCSRRDQARRHARESRRAESPHAQIESRVEVQGNEF